MSIDTGGAAGITIGGTQANAVNIGSSTATTAVKGALTVSGNTSITNTSLTAFVVQNASSLASLTVNTSSNVVQVGSATANSNAIYLALNANNTSGGDPTGGYNGAMYYNSVSNQFRCYQSGAWQNCNGSGALTAIGTFDSQTAQANGLYFAAGTLYAQSASATAPGMVNTGGSNTGYGGNTLQSFVGPKSFTAIINYNCNLTNSTASGSLSGVFPTNYSINNCSTLSVDQTTNGTVTNGTLIPLSLTLPTPTVTNAGRVIYVYNSGTAGFTLNSYYISAGQAQNYIYNGTAWVVVGGTEDATTQVERKYNSQSVTSSTTLVADSSLVFTAQADETWYVEGSGPTAATGGGFQAEWNGATISGAATLSACTMDLSETYNGDNSTSSSCTTAASLPAADFHSPDRINWYGTITTSTAGTITFTWAQAASSGTATTLDEDSYALAYRLVGADYAEIYYSTDGGLSPGEVVSLDGTGPSQIEPSQSAYDPNVIGVVSTQPGQVEGAEDGSGQPVPIGLAGRVPVDVDAENGPIQPGDYLVASSTPGVAMLATNPGMSIGQALTGWTGPGEGSVMMFIKNTYFPGTQTNVLQSSPADAQTTGVGVTSSSDGDPSLQGIDDPDTTSQTLAPTSTAADAQSTTTDTDLTDNLTLSSLVDNGSASFNGDVTIANLSADTLSAQNVQVTGNLNVSGIETVATINAAAALITGNLSVDGTTQLSGNIVLTAAINTSQATIKQFVASTPIGVGSVVVLDSTPGNEGQVTTTIFPEDTRVVGVAVTIATNPGDSVEVAISGWAQVRVDTIPDNSTDNPPAPITPGQLLVTSSQAGTVQAADNPRNGSILGKSTSDQDSNGLVWVIITLQ
jgi:hypothetical protein